MCSEMNMHDIFQRVDRGRLSDEEVYFGLKEIRGTIANLKAFNAGAACIEYFERYEVSFSRMLHTRELPDAGAETPWNYQKPRLNVIHAFPSRKTDDHRPV